MKIEHIAIWVDEIEVMRSFYMTYFNMKSNDIYINIKKNYSAYFLSFEDSETRIEMMHRNDISSSPSNHGMLKGLAHIAISVGNEENVNAITERLRNDGYTIASEPRTTGDGYYESMVLDPEENRIEITV